MEIENGSVGQKFPVPHSLEELRQLEVAFDGASRQLKGGMSEEMFQHSLVLSMMKRLYGLGCAANQDFSELDLDDLMTLVEIISHHQRGVRILLDEIHLKVQGAFSDYLGSMIE